MLWTIALRNLRQGGKRTVLLGLALFLVTGLLVFLMALSKGVNDSMVHAATTIATGHVNVAGFYKPSAKAGAPIITGVGPIRKIAEEKTPGLRMVLERHRGWGKVVSDTSSMWAGLYGVKVETETVLLDTLEATHGDPKRLAELDTCILFTGQAEKLEAKVGDQLTVRTETMQGQSNTTDLTVVAIVEDLGLISTWSLFVPTATILKLYGLKEDTAGSVQLYLENIEDAPKVMASLRAAYSEAGYKVMDHDPQPFWAKFETVGGQEWTGQKLDLTIWRDEVSFMTWVLTAIDSVSFLLIGILAVIIAIGIMNSLWIAVRERTGEVGTLRAIGMSKRKVLAMFVIEAMVLALVACTAGAVISGIVAATVNALAIPIPVKAVSAILMSNTIRLSVDPAQVFTAILAFTFIAGLAALWPAMRAARMPPITAIQITE